jgi:tripartite-type tricarboxylate transporter receptor subunit TctC
MSAGSLVRRWVLLACLVAMPVAHAQDFPAKPIHFVIGSAPGSVIDVVTRQIAECLARELRQPVFVENRFSAGGIVALQALKSSPADGYTLSVVAMPQMSVSNRFALTPCSIAMRATDTPGLRLARINSCLAPSS